MTTFKARAAKCDFDKLGGDITLPILNGHRVVVEAVQAQDFVEQHLDDVRCPTCKRQFPQNEHNANLAALYEREGGKFMEAISRCVPQPFINGMLSKKVKR